MAYIFPLLLHILVCLRQSSQAIASPDESSLLLAFRSQSITSDPSGLLTNWRAAISICNWTGITCHPKHPTRVRSISLPSSALTGIISPLIGQFIHLRLLDLSTNNFLGKIPSELSNCSSLSELRLSSNSLSGSIPDVFLGLPHLSVLELGNNQLQGAVPSSLFNCSGLRVLNLQENRLTGVVSPEFSRLPLLTELSVFQNRLEGTLPPSLANCTRLEVLQLSNNSLSGKIPDEYSSLSELWALHLFTNHLHGSIPPWIGNLSRLSVLGLNDNNFTGPIPWDLGQLRLLNRLYLYNNILSGSFPRSVLNCTRLQNLQLAGNNLTGHVPDEIGRLSELQILSLSRNRLRGTVPPSVGNLSAAWVVAMYGNLLTGEIPETFGLISQLQGISLQENHLTGSIPVAALTNCSKLGFLYLYQNELSGQIPEQLGEIQSLNVLSLGMNRFTGVIPSGIGSLARLQLLDLSSNQLVERIPRTLGQCRDLIRLNLSSNKLSGGIPIELGQLILVNYIDLSFNNLSGRIPEHLASLSNHLIVFNVSMNSLEGRIPSEFSNPSSFLGNPMLCGTLVNRTCLPLQVSRLHHRMVNLRWLVPPAVLGAVLILLGVSVLSRSAARKNKLSRLHAQPEFGAVRCYSYQEISDMAGRFDESNLLGEGGFSKVYRGRITTSDGEKTVAVKVLKQAGPDQEERAEQTFLAEVTTLSKLKHRNIARIVGFSSSRELKALVLDFMPNGSLTGHVHILDWQRKLEILYGVAHAVCYMHHEFDKRIPVIHSDLKPANVLLDSDWNPRVADFGISKLLTGESIGTVSRFKGTIGYAPPEYGAFPHVSTKGDVYSYGILLLELLTGKSPTGDMFREGETLRNWAMNSPEEILTGTESEVEEMGSVLKIGLLCTADSPNSRPTMKKVVLMLRETINPKP